jgi:hypothetical protein
MIPGTYRNKEGNSMLTKMTVDSVPCHTCLTNDVEILLYKTSDKAMEIEKYTHRERLKYAAFLRGQYICCFPWSTP